MTSQPMPGASTRSERRQFHRRNLRAGLEIEWGSATLTATVRDIGPRGLFVELTPPLWVGAAFRARLIVNPVLQLDCTVRRVEPVKELPSPLKCQRRKARRSWERSWRPCRMYDTVS